MAKTEIWIFEKDYDWLSLKAGGSDKICYLMPKIIALVEQSKPEAFKLRAWLEAAENLHGTE